MAGPYHAGWLTPTRLAVWFDPFVGFSQLQAGRLMLALLEHSVSEMGGRMRWKIRTAWLLSPIETGDDRLPRGRRERPRMVDSYKGVVVEASPRNIQSICSAQSI